MNLDDLAHVNNKASHWVQEVAKALWESITANLIYDFDFWIVRPPSLNIKKAAKLGEKIITSTYI